MQGDTMEKLCVDNTAALASFSQMCVEQGLLQRPSDLKEGDVSDGINDKTTLLRFLQARKMNHADALEQFQKAIKFHTDKKALPLYDFISVDDYEDTRKLYPHWTGRRDKRGLPILMIDAAHLNQAAMVEWQKTRIITPSSPDGPAPSADMAQRALVFHDGLTRFILPLCTAMTDRPDPSLPVTNSVYLVDASCISLKQAWDLKDFAQDVSWILATCYPETIDRIFVCNVSSYITTIWGVLKKFVDPVTAEKIIFLKSNNVFPTLEKYIDPENIPSQLGGRFTFTNGMLPDLDTGIRNALHWMTPPDDSGTGSLPLGPIKWVEDEGGRREAVATGSVGELQRMEKVAALGLSTGFKIVIPQ